MSSVSLRTSFTEFEAASMKFDVVPVRAVIDGIACRPVDAFRTLRELGTQKINGPGFILESESPEAGASRYSYVCPLAESVVRTGERETLGDIDPIQALRNRFESRTVAPVADLPGLISGAFGYVAYEAITHFEPSVGDLPEDPTGSPSAAFLFPRELLVFDHLLDQQPGNGAGPDGRVRRVPMSLRRNRSIAAPTNARPTASSSGCCQPRVCSSGLLSPWYQ